MPLQHAAEDQVMHRERRVERIADRVGEVEVGEAARLREAHRVQHDDGVELGRLRPDRLELRARELGAIHVGQELHPLEAEVLDHVLELGERRRILQRNRAEPGEAFRLVRDEGRDALVHHLAACSFGAS